MSPSLPAGDDAPPAGDLPATVRAGAEARGFSVYVHVPYCAVRCGYCDFNTYVADELGVGSGPADYLAGLGAEFALARRVLADAGLPERPVSTVFVGGGTPTLLPAATLGVLLGQLRDTFEFAPDVEVTTEANPDSVTQESLQRLAASGFTRVSFGMQSAVPHVLATLDRTHDPRRIGDVVAWARTAGLQVSLDLIYGTPGESQRDWQVSVEAAVSHAPDHISAYALTVEPGTRMHAKVRRGELPDVDPDDQADKYELADAALTAAGYGWYEISNWATGSATQCRHNLAYWRGDDWWGFGPGAHSHVGGVRWWNVKHPHRYAEVLAAGRSPAAAREVLTVEQRRLEHDMLAIRLADGFSAATEQMTDLVGDGLVTTREPGRFVLTRTGRLLADRVTAALTD
jgi:putative oxygen-independent coproporphyrinogen III oxidase